jgi:hypothetical protein
MKLKDILKAVKVGSGIGKVFLPGGVGKVLDIVNANIADDSDPQNEGALKHLADVDDQIIEAMQDHERRLKALEKR